MGPSISQERSLTGENADADQLSHHPVPNSDHEHGNEDAVQQAPARNVKTARPTQDDNVDHGEPTADCDVGPGEPANYELHTADGRTVENFLVRRDSWRTTVATDFLFDTLDPLFKTTASQSFDIAASGSISHTEQYPSISAAVSTSNSRPNRTPQARRDRNALQREKAVKKVYKIIAEQRPEVTDIIEQDLGSLWEFVQNCPHPLALYCSSTSLTPHRTLHNSKLDLSLVETSKRENAFNYSLARRLGLLRPRNPESMAMLVPCGLSWDLEFNMTLKRNLRKQVFETIHGRWNAIFLARKAVKLWDGPLDLRKPPAVWLKALDSYLSTVAWTSLQNYPPFEIVILDREIHRLIKTDPLSIQDHSPELSTRLILYEFARRLRDHNLTFRIPPSLEMSEGQRMWATLKFYSFFLIACTEPYGSVILPQKDIDIWANIKTPTFEESWFRNDKEMTIQIDTISFATKSKDKYKARARIQENRRHFKAFNLPHRPKSSPSVAVDDPSHWFLAVPGNT